MKTRLPGNLATVLNLHLAGLALLVIVNLFLLTKLAIAWHDANSQRPEVVQQEKLAYKALELQAAPLRGLPGKVELARTDAGKFYELRIPANYSSIAAELGTLAVKNERSPHTRAIHSIACTRRPGRDSHGCCVKW